MGVFKDNVVVLIGASRGIGEELAYLLAQQKACLVLAARSGDDLMRVARGCKKRGTMPLVLPTDITSEKACKELIHETVSHYGQLDTLLYNAGGGETTSFANRQDLSSAYEELELNYMGLLYSLFYALPHLKEVHGRIVGVSSMGGLLGLPGTATYNSSKHAMSGLLKTLRVELLGTGISVTTIYLGAVRTESFLKAVGERALRVPSLSPEEAATRIIKAASRRRGEVIPSLQGRILSFTYSLVPGIMDRLLQKVGSLYEERYLEETSTKH